MESPPEKHGEQRQELPELPELQVIIPHPEVKKGKTMPPDIINVDISKILDKQRQKDREKRKKTPSPNN